MSSSYWIMPSAAAVVSARPTLALFGPRSLVASRACVAAAAAAAAAADAVDEEDADIEIDR